MSIEIDTWPEQKSRGSKIPGYRYTSKEFFEKEWEGMWTKTWLLLGREAEVPKPGNWQMEPVGPEEILMVRQKDGSVKAFYNVCQHRGNQLKQESKGHSGRFVCPYHSWSFQLDGSLFFAPDKEDFPEGNPCEKIRLAELRCETFAGFIWVNMDPDCISLKEFLGPIWEAWENRELHTWTRTMANSMWLPCNWKIPIDNFNEIYHVPPIHMHATPAADRTKIHSLVAGHHSEARLDLSDEGHNRLVLKASYGIGVTDKEGNIIGPLGQQLRYWGLDPAGFKERPENTREALRKAKREKGPERSYTHYEKVPDEQLTDDFHYTLFPNFAVSLWADGFHFMRLRPHASDPEQCLLDSWWYASPASKDQVYALGLFPARGEDVRENGEAPLVMKEFGKDSMEPSPIIEEDIEVFVTQQRGYHSRGYKGVYLSNQEKRIRRHHELIDDYIYKYSGERFED